MSEKKFDEQTFQSAVVALNGFLKLKEKPEIVVEGLSDEDKLKMFLAPIIEALEENEAGELPAEVIEFYNNNLAEEDEEETEETEEEKPKKKGKKEKKKKDPKEKKERKPRSNENKDAWGCTIGSGASKINAYLNEGEGKTIKELIQLVGTTRSRVQSHISSLKVKGFFIDNFSGVYKFVDKAPTPQDPRPKKEKAPKKEKSEKVEKTEKAPKKKKSEKKPEPKEENISQKEDSPKKESKKEEKGK